MPASEPGSPSLDEILTRQRIGAAFGVLTGPNRGVTDNALCLSDTERNVIQPGPEPIPSSAGPLRPRSHRPVGPRRSRRPGCWSPPLQRDHRQSETPTKPRRRTLSRTGTGPMTRHTDTELPDGEHVLTVAAGVTAVACLLVWAAGQLAGRIWVGQWPPVSLLDSPLIVIHLITNPEDPGGAWQPAATELVPGPTAFYAVLVFLTLTAAFIVGYGWHLWQQNARKDDDGARWAKPRDLKPLLVRRPQPGRLTLGTVNGRLVATEAQHSVAVIGPAGTGKTTGFAIPALLEWDGPVLATSVKGDLLEDTITHRRTIGETWVFDPVGSTAEPSAGWSPLHASSRLAGCSPYGRLARINR